MNELCRLQPLHSLLIALVTVHLLVPPAGTAAEAVPELSQPGSGTVNTPSPLNEPHPAPYSGPSETGETRNVFDRFHGEVSHRLLSSAAWLDSFFADERSLKEENRSYIRIRYDVFREEYARLTTQPSFDVRIVLPQLQKKTHLVFSAEPEDTVAGAPATASTSGSHIGPSEDRNVTTALHYLYRMTTKESFIIRTGAQYVDGRPVVFLAPRYRSLLPLNSWDLRFTQEALYRTDTGWQAGTRFDLERQLPNDLFFRTGVDGLWMANTHGYFYSVGCTLRQPFDAENALQYEWVSSYQTRPVNELTEIAFRVRYRKSFWREWIFFELAPQERFPRAANFRGLPGILFRLEMFFGRQS